jgi:hypothetical protein
VIAALLVGSVAMNFLAAFLPVLDRLHWLNLMSFYEPASIVRDGVWPVLDITVLTGVAVISLVTAAIVWSRRDIPAP